MCAARHELRVVRCALHHALRVLRRALRIVILLSFAVLCIRYHPAHILIVLRFVPRARPTLLVATVATVSSGPEPPRTPEPLEPPNPRTPSNPPSNPRTSESPSRAPCGMKARPRCSSSQATIPARSAWNVSRETFVPVRFAARWLRMRLGFFCNIQLRGNGFHGDRSAEHSAFMPPHGVSFVRALACGSWIGGRGNRARRC